MSKVSLGTLIHAKTTPVYRSFNRRPVIRLCTLVHSLCALFSKVHSVTILCSCCTIFMLPFFPVKLSSCSTLFMLTVSRIAVFSCFSISFTFHVLPFFMLHFFHILYSFSVALSASWILFMLQFFRVALFSCFDISMLYFFPVALFSWCFFLFHSFHVALSLCCTYLFFMCYVKFVIMLKHSAIVPVVNFSQMECFCFASMLQ